MGGVFDAIQQGIAEHHVRMRHVNLGAQDLLAVGILAVPHFAEEFQVLFGGTVAPGALGAGLVHGPASRADFVLRLVVHIGQAAVDELLGPGIELVEVIRCI